MGEYQKFNQDDINPSVVSVNGMQVESLLLEKDEGIMLSAQRFKRCGWVVLLLAIPMPIAAWFVDENHVLFIQSWAFFAAQILLALIGFRALRHDIYKRLSTLKKFIHIYFIALLLDLVANMSGFTYAVVKHNKDHCSDFDFYEVCKDRWGMMGAQLALIIFYPLILSAVLLTYRYYLHATKELMNSLLQREL